VECAACGCVRLDPIPTSEDLCTLHQQSVQFADAHYTDPTAVARMLQHQGSCLDHCGRMPADGEAMLEVGAGWARVARALHQRRPAVATSTQDVTDKCATCSPRVDHYVLGTPTRCRGTYRSSSSR